MTREWTYLQGIVMVVEVDLLGDPKKGRVVEIHDNRHRLCPLSVIDRAAEEWNEAAITVEYRAAQWRGEDIPKLNQSVDIEGDTAVGLGEMESYKQAHDEYIREINKFKAKINAFEKKHIIDNGWGH